jgi:pimeloyl-ACP methyl ester carboxylesterase
VVLTLLSYDRVDRRVAMAGLSYSGALNQRIRGANGIEYMYRELGDGATPPILVQHFRGNLDNWDPALVDELAVSRQVVAFDNVGVGGTSGCVPHSIGAMAHGATAFIEAMGCEKVDWSGGRSGNQCRGVLGRLLHAIGGEPAGR